MMQVAVMVAAEVTVAEVVETLEETQTPAMCSVWRGSPKEGCSIFSFLNSPTPTTHKH